MRDGRQAVREERRAYGLVNNRAEGNAPLTVQALVDRFHGDTGGAATRANLFLNHCCSSQFPEQVPLLPSETAAITSGTVA
ncbi:hypothetical protein [Nitrospira moscoviensis]|uniref:Uncharacterized protein n=1 Tax=Nitrospira moscoviensis TaxID=42253 RepID=A0A0K2GER2_NITMO|nr:hypothetical protein [Nitrospira moscoviensis]ALA59436.1 hypothetical protein NITMOv2_3036 [Nitrospira moscoviensis]